MQQVPQAPPQPPTEEEMARLFIDRAAGCTTPRPRPLSLWGPTVETNDVADYVSWTGLVDRTWSGRHLPPASDDWMRGLPELGALDVLFARRKEIPSPRSSALFCFFAQWLTDSFLRTDPDDFRKNTSNHEIDLCQIYGLTAADTKLLRSRRHGKLASQTIDGQEYPAALFRKDGRKVRRRFRGLSYLGTSRGLDAIIPPAFARTARRETLFATGLERGNSSVFYTAISTVFLREHNRLCDVMRAAHPTWDDDRLFETARNVNLVQLLKIVIEDYIGHISPRPFPVRLETGFAESRPWYRTNRIAAEFNLLYRWHSLVPDDVPLPGIAAFRQVQFNNDPLLDLGLATVLRAATERPAGRIGLHNTPAFLMDAEREAMRKSRAWKVRSFNEYCWQYGLRPRSTFLDLTGDDEVAAELAAHYASIEDVELIVGLLAEKRVAGALYGELMSRMVAADAFSQALTNPLLAAGIYGVSTFSAVGMEAIDSCGSLNDLVNRGTRPATVATSFSKVVAAAGVAKKTTAATRAPMVPNEANIKAYVEDGDTFLRKQWAAADGVDVFRIDLAETVVAILDPTAIAMLFDAKTITHDYGFGFAVPPYPLVGEIVPTIFRSGPEHDRPKAVYIALLAKWRGTLLENFDRTAAEFRKKWLAMPSLRFRDELEDFAATFVFAWMVGMKPDPRKVSDLYVNLFDRRSPLVYDAQLARSRTTYASLLADLEASRAFGEIGAVAHTMGWTDDAAIARQILFLTGMNAFLGLQNIAKSILGELTRHPELRERLRSEIESTWPKHASIDLESLAPGKMPLLDQTIREVLRVHPPVSTIWGRPKDDCTIESNGRSYPVRKGELMLGVISIAQRNSRFFPDGPDTFREPGVADPYPDTHLIWPRGAHQGEVAPDTRTCPARNDAFLLMKLMAVWLLRNFEWTLDRPPTWNTRAEDALNRSAPDGEMKGTIKAR